MALTDDDIMPFGKHIGKKLSEVPDSWWVFMYDRKKLSPALVAYAEEKVHQLNLLKHFREEKATRNRDQGRTHPGPEADQ